VQRKIQQGKKTRIVAVEPSSCPSLTAGELRYDFGDTAETTPLMMMHTLGHKFMPPSIHAGGLRYHGMAPMVSHCLKLGLVEAQAVPQLKVFGAAVQFARAEGIVPAPESSHAIAAAVEEAEKCRVEGKKRVIVIGLSGNGLLDLAAYDSFLGGHMHDTGADD
jgi:tryptophan synthase beta chain